MDTKRAYGEMKEANRIIEDFPIGQYAFYTALFLAEIAICFVVAYVIKS